MGPLNLKLCRQRIYLFIYRRISLILSSGFFRTSCRCTSFSWRSDASYPKSQGCKRYRFSTFRRRLGWEHCRSCRSSSTIPPIGRVRFLPALPRTCPPSLPPLLLTPTRTAFVLLPELFAIPPSSHRTVATEGRLLLFIYMNSLHQNFSRKCTKVHVAGVFESKTCFLGVSVHEGSLHYRCNIKPKNSNPTALVDCLYWN